MSTNYRSNKKPHILHSPHRIFSTYITIHFPLTKPHIQQDLEISRCRTHNNCKYHTFLLLKMAKATHILNKSLNTSSFYYSSWTVNFNPTHYYSRLSIFSNNNINKYNTISNKNVLRVRRLTTFFHISTYNNNNICTCAHSFCRSCSSTTKVFVMSSDGSHPSSQDSSKTVRCVIKGRVQGVFYRNWTVENANQLGLRGWVRNKRDGSVEALFSGKPESVDEMMQRCRRGPPDAMVTAFQANPCNDDPGTGFERRPTV